MTKSGVNERKTVFLHALFKHRRIYAIGQSGQRDTNYGLACQLRYSSPSNGFVNSFSILVGPLVVREKRVDDLLHGVVVDQLVLGQLGPGDGVKVSDPVEVLLDVLAVVGDAGGRDDGVLEDLEADLAAEEVRHVALLPPLVDLGEERVDLGHAGVRLLLDLFHLDEINKALYEEHS